MKIHIPDKLRIPPMPNICPKDPGEIVNRDVLPPLQNRLPPIPIIIPPMPDVMPPVLHVIPPIPLKTTNNDKGKI